MQTVRPRNVEELLGAVVEAGRTGGKLAIHGGASKAAIGAPTPEAALLDMGEFAGIVDYDPAELVLTAGAATPLADVQAAVAGERQMLAFEPFEHGPILGTQGRATIGGVIAAGVAGSQRLTQGAARDHLLGFEAVSGRAERFVAGAKVVKNVTGYDLPKLAAGSWGRLFAMTQVTLKVLPAPRASLTKIVEGLPFEEARRLMAAALGSQAEVAAAAYLPSGTDGGASLTLMRVQGFGPSVNARSTMLDALAARFGSPRNAGDDEAEAAWSALRTLDALSKTEPLWRIGVPASEGPAFVAALGDSNARWLADWGGGLIWMTTGRDADAIRSAAAAAGGHAMLVRAPEEMRLRVPVRHPQAVGVAALETRIRRAFDPAGVFETGRFRETVR